jgi:hypothetical protein
MKASDYLSGKISKNTKYLEQSVADIYETILEQNPSFVTPFCLGYKKIFSENEKWYKNHFKKSGWLFYKKLINGSSVYFLKPFPQWNWVWINWKLTNIIKFAHFLSI